jgi:hypothetical protein
MCECDGRCDSHNGVCRAIHDEPHPLTGSRVILTTMHLDHDTKNNDYDNLMAACQKCHLAYDADFHALNAAKTRYERKTAAGQLELIDSLPEWRIE